MDSIILSKDFDIKHVVIDEKMKVLDNGSKIKMISYFKNPLILQTPEFYLPYGINNNNMGDENIIKYVMDMSFQDKDKRIGLNRFFKLISDLDDLVVDTGFKNHKEWFKTSFPSKDLLKDTIYSPMIKYSKDKETGEINDAYPPTFRFKLPYAKNKFQVEFFDYDTQPMDGHQLVKLNTKGAKAISIIKCTGIWFGLGKFGVSWKAVQVQIAPKINAVGGCSIQHVVDEQDDSDDEL